MGASATRAVELALSVQSSGRDVSCERPAWSESKVLVAMNDPDESS
jgi:hypothetical protein